jgi:hypothetical protein
LKFAAGKDRNPLAGGGTTLRSLASTAAGAQVVSDAAKPTRAHLVLLIDIMSTTVTRPAFPNNTRRAKRHSVVGYAYRSMTLCVRKLYQRGTSFRQWPALRLPGRGCQPRKIAADHGVGGSSCYFSRNSSRPTVMVIRPALTSSTRPGSVRRVTTTAVWWSIGRWPTSTTSAS